MTGAFLVSKVSMTRNCGILKIVGFLKEFVQRKGE